MIRTGMPILIAAAGAHAQTLTWLTDAPDGTTLQPDDTITVTFSALMEEPTGAPFVALSATVFDIINDVGVDAGQVLTWKFLNDFGMYDPTVLSTDYHSFFDVSVGQLTLFGPFTSDNPVDVFQFSWQATTPGDVAYHTETEAAMLWVGEDKQSATAVAAQPIEAEFGWTVVPAPTTTALITLGALWVVRRRRDDMSR